MDFFDDYESPMTPQAVAALCGVCERTARRWIAGHTKPPKAARELIRLHQRGRVMPTKWPYGWRFNESGFLDIGHSQALAWQQVDWYFFSISCWYSLLELLPRIEARIDELMKTATTAQVIDLQKYRDELQALKNRQFALPADLREYYATGEKEIHRKAGC